MELFENEYISIKDELKSFYEHNKEDYPVAGHHITEVVVLKVYSRSFRPIKELKIKKIAKSKKENIGYIYTL